MQLVSSLAAGGSAAYRCSAAACRWRIAFARVRWIVARTRRIAVVPHVALRRHKALLAVANQVFAPASRSALRTSG